MEVHPFLAKQDAKVKQPGHMNAKQKDQQTTNQFEPFKALMQVALKVARGNTSNSPKQNKNNRETKDEAKRVTQDRQPDLGIGMFCLKLFEGEAGNVGQI